MIKKMLYNLFKFIFLFIFFNTFTNKLVFGEEAYFDLSDNEIQIQTDFNGKEVIIFGLTDPELDTVLTIKGPNKDTQVSKKERLFGFWFNTKKIIYRDLPSIFFIASSSPIKKILNDDTIVKKSFILKKCLLICLHNEILILLIKTNLRCGTKI